MSTSRSHTLKARKACVTRVFGLLEIEGYSYDEQVRMVAQTTQSTEANVQRWWPRGIDKAQSSPKGYRYDLLADMRDDLKGNNTPTSSKTLNSESAIATALRALADAIEQGA